MRNLKQENMRTTSAKRRTNKGATQHYTGGSGLYNSRNEHQGSDKPTSSRFYSLVRKWRESEFI